MCPLNLHSRKAIPMYTKALLRVLPTLALWCLLVAAKVQLDSTLIDSLIKLYAAVIVGITVLCLISSSLRHRIIDSSIQTDGIAMLRLSTRLSLNLSPIPALLLWLVGYYIIGALVFASTIVGDVLIWQYLNKVEKDATKSL